MNALSRGRKVIKKYVKRNEYWLRRQNFDCASCDKKNDYTAKNSMLK